MFQAANALKPMNKPKNAKERYEALSPPTVVADSLRIFVLEHFAE
jgi:hypothetical protein